VLLFTGGVASLCVWYLTGAPLPVFVQIGAPYELAMTEVLDGLAQRIAGFEPVTLTGPPIGENADVTAGYIPHRHLALLVAAAAWMRPSVIYTSTVLGEVEADRSRAWHRATSRALAGDGPTIRVVAPAARMTKTGLLRRTLRDYPQVAELLPLTRSCYLPVGQPCGACPGCFRRAVAEFHCGLRANPPLLPEEAGWGSGWAAARQIGVRRWPGLAVDGALSGLALAGIRV
jgi:hypothetical protein